MLVPFLSTFLLAGSIATVAANSIPQPDAAVPNHLVSSSFDQQLPHAHVSSSRHRRRASFGSPPTQKHSHKRRSPKSKKCVKKSQNSGLKFPALGFQMPSSVPDTTSGWWSDPTDEYAFMGFSYGVDSCPSEDSMTSDFKNMRNNFKARYVRLYSYCDKKGFNDDMINAAWNAGVGLYPLIWFGFDGGDQWKARKTSLMKAINSNPKAPFVVRNVVVGSEPLFDSVLSVGALTSVIDDVKNVLSGHGIGATISEMPYAYQNNGGAKSIVNAVDELQGNILPFFDQAATTASNAWSSLSWNINYFKQHGQGKKILITETGWPSSTAIWPANSGSAVANIKQSQAYFELLDSKCSYFKKQPGGGLGWFAQIWDNDNLSGWGVTENGKARYSFSPRTSC